MSLDYKNKDKRIKEKFTGHTIFAPTAICVTCFYLTRLDCPRQNELDQYESPVKPFAVVCRNYKPYREDRFHMPFFRSYDVL